MQSPEQLEQAHRNERYSSSFELGLIERSARLLVSQLKGKSVLELGCGLGITTAQLLPHTDHLTVVEASEYFLEQTISRTGNAHATWVNLPWEEYVPARHFSDIVFFRGLDCVEDVDSMFNLLKKWSDSETCIHIVITNTNSFHRLVGEQLQLDKTGQLTERAKEVGRLQALDDQVMQSLFDRHGLQIMHREGIGFKMFANSQMDTLDSDLKDVFLRMGHVCPDHAVELYYKVTCA